MHVMGEARGVLHISSLLPRREPDRLFLSFSIALRFPLWSVRTVAVSEANAIGFAPGIRLFPKHHSVFLILLRQSLVNIPFTSKPANPICKLWALLKELVNAFYSEKRTSTKSPFSGTPRSGGARTRMAWGQSQSG